jgi:transposase
MRKRSVVALTEAERQMLEQFVQKEEPTVIKVRHARILLLADTKNENGGWQDPLISKALNLSLSTVRRVRTQWAGQRIEAAYWEQITSQKPRKRKFDNEQESRIVAIARDPVPTGFARWSLRLLAKRLVELGVVEKISRGTVRRILLKANITLGSRRRRILISLQQKSKSL